MTPSGCGHRCAGRRSVVMRMALPVLAASLLFGCAGARGISSEAVGSVTETRPLDQVHWGMLFVDAESGGVLLSRAEERKFVPASNMKLLVTTAALAELGPEHRFLTALDAEGAVDRVGGRIEGDLVVRGSGDPTLSERFWPDDEAPLRAIADSLVAAGIREVAGELVVDASQWDSMTVAGTWMVANLPWSYSATGGAFAISEGETRLIVAAGERPGVPAQVDWSPRGRPDFVVPYVLTGPSGNGEDADLDVAYLPESRRLQLRGTVPAGTVDTISVATRDPVREAAAALHRVLRERGVRVRDGWRVRWDRPVDTVPSSRLVTFVSPPLMEIAEAILEPSQNWMTEQLAKALGGSDSTRAGWSTGLRRIERILTETVGVDTLDLALRDGSGLSAYNLVTPRAVVGLLRWVRGQPWGDAYRNALAEPGEEGSTLSRRLEGLEGRLWAKTGTISNVNSLSGYLVTDEGRTVVFSLLTNGSGLPSNVVRRGMDDIVRAVAAGG